MSSNQNKALNSVKSVRKVAAKATQKTGSALALIANRLDARTVKHARSRLKGLSRRTEKFVKRNPVRVLLGASVIGFALAKLQRLI
jgi:ElaB/YqjD/DUF883 family membrane-anchored ribosome-binding protein